MSKRSIVLAAWLVGIVVLGVGIGLAAAYIAGSDDRAQSQAARTSAEQSASRAQKATADAEALTALVESLCKDAVANEGFKDPGSLIYRDITQERAGGPREWDVTGQVNGKNSYGAYVGFSEFDCKVRPEGAGGQMKVTYVYVFGN